MLKIDICDDEQLWCSKVRMIINDTLNDRQEINMIKQ